MPTKSQDTKKSSVTSSPGGSRQTCRFEVRQILIGAAGEQRAVVDGQVTTRARSPHQTISVMIGDLLVYCRDLASVRAMTAAWQVAAEFALQIVPVDVRPLRRNLHGAGIVLRVQGNPGTHKVLGIPAAGHPLGIPAVRVSVGPLTVDAHDRAAVTCWHRTWAEALEIATRLWPEPDAFDQAEARERDLIARYGASKKPPRT